VTGDHGLDGWSQEERNKKPKIVNNFRISIGNAKTLSSVCLLFSSSFPFPLSFEFKFLRLGPLDSGGCINIALWRTAQVPLAREMWRKSPFKGGGEERSEGDGGVLTN
jgi:hypothetical protein